MSGATMDCQTARVALLDEHRGRLDVAAGEALAAHLRECPGCARHEIAERLLTEQLERQLPQYAAPLALKRRLAAQWPARGAVRTRPRRWWLGAAAGTAVVLAILSGWSWLGPTEDAEALLTEAVNDHLRVLARIERLEISSADMHVVRPWLTGRLDFAPVIRFPGDAEFPLRGGAIEHFLDRRAAITVYGRRLHVVTLLVTRPDGLPWPPAGRQLATRVRGFNVRLWRADGLGYALVSDVDAAELSRLATRLGG